jgi:ABC-type transport system substrate-binding protein
MGNLREARNTPDAPHPGRARAGAEIAAAMPTISPDHLTYTFQIRDDYAFSPPASGVVTAESMKWTFERTLSPSMVSPAGAFYTNIVGATEYMNGQAQHISGIVADGDTQTIHLIQPQGHFLTLLAMPFLCAVPTTLPAVEQTTGPIPSAGPYYITDARGERTQRSAATRTTTGRARGRWDSIDYHFGETEQGVRALVESGSLDDGLWKLGPWAELQSALRPGQRRARVEVSSSGSRIHKAASATCR